MVEDYGHWDITNVGEFDYRLFFGFVYEIEDRYTGRSYIGKKQFFFKCKKTIKHPFKTKESDWKTYTSSCKPLVEDIQLKGLDHFNFRIISLCSGRCQLTYEEQQVQFNRDVLRTLLPNGEKKYWNKTIGHFLFSGVEKQTEETKRKMSLAHIGKVRTPEHQEKLNVSRRGVPRDPETRKKMSDARIGIPVPKESVDKRSQILTYEVIHPNTYVSIVRNLSNFCKTYDLNSGAMYQVAKGRTSHHKGYVCTKYIPPTSNVAISCS